MSLAVAAAQPKLAFGAPTGGSIGQAVGGLGAFSQAAYRHADEIRRSIDLPAAQPSGGAPGAAAIAAAVGGFLASPAGHAALERLANAGTGWLERALGVAGAAEQLALPLA